MIMVMMMLMMLIMIINGYYKESIIWGNCLWPYLLRLMAAQWFLWIVPISGTLCLSLVILAFLDKIKTWQSFKLSTLIFYHGDWNRLWLWTSWRLWPWQTIRHQFESPQVLLMHHLFHDLLLLFKWWLEAWGLRIVTMTNDASSISFLGASFETLLTL